MDRPGTSLGRGVRALLGLCLLVGGAQAQMGRQITPEGAQTGPSGVQRPAAGDPVRVEVIAGWGHLRIGDELQWLTRQAGPRLHHRSFYLELGVESVVELAWSGSASLRLTGPAGVFVDPVSGPLGGRAVGFRRLASAEIEVRRGALAVSLPRGQRLLPHGSSFRLEGHPGGLVDLFHRAGDPLELDVGARYTFPLPVGTRRRLPECIAPVLAIPPTTRGPRR
ncbi:hypothetical protein [Engelhardtia mirabilis]|uniref:FecR protein domain-containing protein n=1 Tax=Engelhardtia mirabilis TaxID=2528011 RepID=A0A518BJX9_9BACT|nr:hypothetical protein Pla133_23610 [Planctomycetes bacterium Pla133]QDV01608.1 hypothetical protein Pla86_23600 [Planctomycetes bacterium Pla86]